MSFYTTPTNVETTASGRCARSQKSGGAGL